MEEGAIHRYPASPDTGSADRAPLQDLRLQGGRVSTRRAARGRRSRSRCSTQGNRAKIT
jgi:hypothetical protein